ncbi:MAG: glutamate-5-semialdehyde dehydrogenase [Proteobacteria bacterium]|nr:glutamate-5-semialdehyde dehydrogenase [Pseudomonadota bacterium]
MSELSAYIEQCGLRAHEASVLLSKSTSSQRIQALKTIALDIRRRKDEIIAQNEIDLREAKESGLSSAMLDRLKLNESRIELMASSIEQIAEQPEIIGRLEDERIRPNGLKVARMRIPLGVIAIIYEARPNVTSDAAALCLKTANAVILKGGKEALHSNISIAHIIQDALEASGLPRDAVLLIETTDREAVSILIKQNKTVDLLIPRGGEGLIRFVSENATIPVIQHYKGVCHIFVEKTADINKAIPILLNAKCQRPGVCNAMETLLLDEGLPIESQRQLLKPLADNGVTLHADEQLMRDLGTEFSMVPANEEDWPKEYLSLDLAVRRVAGLDGAIEHISRYSSLHTESILTENTELAERFVREINSSTVLINASTRFADGGELGLGAEIGISTSKLHAFGPMGCEELTTRKFVVHGDGQIRK